MPLFLQSDRWDSWRSYEGLCGSQGAFGDRMVPSAHSRTCQPEVT